MDERGAGTPWHELEGVTAGQERVPGLLRGLLIPGLRGSSWAQLEELFGWRSDEPLFVEIAGRLFELLPQLDRHRRALVLGLLARRAEGIGERRVGVHRHTFLAFAARAHLVVPLVSDRSAEVRTGAAWVLRGLRQEDPAALDALRRQAAVERDSTALVSQLLAVGVLSGPGDRPAAAEWARAWLDQRDPLVRLASARVVLTAAPGGAQGAGRRVAGVFAEIGTGRLPEVPWSEGYKSVDRYAVQVAAHPREGEALVEGLARHRDPALRAQAVRAAGLQLRSWRRPAAHLWETVAAGLEDEPEVADEALVALAGCGSAAAPYADRIVRAVERPVGPGWRGSHAALGALVRFEDPRALPLYLRRFGDSQDVGPLPVRWAPELLPVFRERLAMGPGARGTDEVLRILAPWGPAAAPAVPELADLLDTRSARPAAEALGRIGPAASAAAGALAALARGETSPWRFGVGTERSPKPWQGAQTAAWAHWRVTGDPELALWVGGAAARAGLGRPVLRYLADLGPLAAPYADSVRALLDCPGEWIRVGAAEAWWRITGDPAPAVAALLPELAPLAEHRVTELTLRTVRALGAIGPPAAAALPALRAVAAGPPRRYGASLLMDEELLRDAREAVDRIGGR
ncbi:hypothetical protein [Streptomyces sp. AP-93]|uniref:hypothetical protein n=1 Tax=Streptomyces sp. AP-93 TaxID=2929048 RepID=UPI001FAF58D0|nr:hypothetical protein [Streptomyces sp. AP-93]MCJ0873193.1 hypothetical protein [Streptomyces sp. AP-93]